MAMSASEKKAKFRYNRGMSTEDLLEWLHANGLNRTECNIIRKEEFTGESFLLLNENDIKEMGIKRAGQMLLKKLLIEIEGSGAEVENPASTPTSRASGERADDSRNDLSVGPDPVLSKSAEIKNLLTLQASSSREDSGQQNDVERVEPSAQETGSEVNRVEENEDEARVEEVPTYCTSGPYEGSSVFSYDHSIFMYRSKVWAGRQVLRVYFINPEVLSQWGLTVDTIMNWTKAWPCDNELIPTFQESTVLKKADIRVKFSNTEGCWSTVGMDAEKTVGQEQPTMLLNLKGHSPELQESLVIHEFGHALGLEHEHQRSDFWDVVRKYFDVSKMPQAQRLRVKKTEEAKKREACCYDSESIMHYWFNLKWLKNTTYQNLRNVKSGELPQKERRYLLGVHERQGSKVLPQRPSNSDFQQLIETYTNPGSRNTSPSPRPSPMPSPKVSPKTSPVPSPKPSPTFFRKIFQNQQAAVLRVDDHLRGILSTVWSARAKWRVIGLELGLSPHDLDAYNIMSPGDSLETVLRNWMYKGNATIDQLITALQSSLVDRKDIADTIVSMTS